MAPLLQVCTGVPTQVLASAECVIARRVLQPGAVASTVIDTVFDIGLVS